MKDILGNLQQLEQLRSLKSKKRLAELQKEEQELRLQLRTLSEHRRISTSIDQSLFTMRAIGADVLWQSWIDRTQAELNTELAKLLVRKEPIARTAQRDSSRSEVVEAIAKDHRDQDVKEKSKQSLLSMLETASSMQAAARCRNSNI